MNKIAGFFAAVGIALAGAGTASAAAIIKTYDFNGPVANLSAPADVSGDFTLNLMTSKILGFDFSTPFGPLDGSDGLFTKLTGGVDDLTFVGLAGGKLNTLNLLFDPTTGVFDETLRITKHVTLSSDDTCASLAKVCEGGHDFVADFTDAATVSAAPEPATWAIMLIGFLGLGAILRGARRKQVGAIAAA